MRRFDFPTAPVVVGMILGPLAEAQLRNAVSIGEGSAMVFLQRPMSVGAGGAHRGRAAAAAPVQAHAEAKARAGRLNAGTAG